MLRSFWSASAAMFEVLASGEYYAEIVDGGAGELEDLKPLLAGVCRQRFRRIDRFTQLALLGSARCIRDRELLAATGLYISSGFGSIANTVKVQRQIMVDSGVPKPADFINTLSNSAGFYVARNLGLQSRNQFVGRDAAPLEAALQIATLDLSVGNVEQALVGVVDEIATPVEEHARRLGVDAATPLAEGSHWLLLRQATRDELLPTLAEVRTLFSMDELAAWLRDVDSASAVRLWFVDAAGAPAPAACAAFKCYEHEAGAYRSRTAGAVSKFMNDAGGGTLITVAADAGRYHVTRFAQGC
jgi:hypothetical protein